MGWLEWATSFLDPPEISNQRNERRKNDKENADALRNLTNKELKQ